MANFMRIFLSMKSMGVMLLIFAFAIGAATFIENDFGTRAAKSVVYNAKWFEFLLFLLCINLVSNIFTYRLYKLEKLPIFLFHISFLVIFIGAAITRYIGFEGSMHIREGSSSSSIISERSYINIDINDEKGAKSFEKQVLLSPLSDYKSKDSFELNGKKYIVELKDYKANAAKFIEEKGDGRAILSLVASGDGAGREDIMLVDGEMHNLYGATICLNKNGCDIEIRSNEDTLEIKSDKKIEYVLMDSGEGGELDASSFVPLKNRTLYRIGESSFVVREFVKKGVVVYKSVRGANKDAFEDMLVFDITKDGATKELAVFGLPGKEGAIYSVDLGGSLVHIRYGSKEIKLPFSISLEKFELQRYPGSMSPASYASYVKVSDFESKNEFDYKIYMNHILEHQGYRFYQASYDKDEKGTILSVNHDYYGTLITYIGYILMGLGMFWGIFAKKGRVANLYKKTKDITKVSAGLLLVAFMFMGQDVRAEENLSGEDIIKTITSIDLEHAKRFGELLVQDSGGRIKPVDTLAFDLLNKIHRGGDVYGLHPNQVLLGMIVRPSMWQKIKLIAINHPDIKEKIGISKDEKYAAFGDLFDFSSPESYKIGGMIEEASIKKPSAQGKLDKEVLKVDERINISYMVFTGELLKILPKEGDPNNKWFGPLEAFQNFEEIQGKEAQQLVVNYFKGVDVGIGSGNWGEADKALEELKNFQAKYGSAVMVHPSKVKAEILYNNMQVFKKLFPVYGLVGLILLGFSIYHIIKPLRIINTVKNISLVILGVAFLIHTAVLGLRWYISGHAPWSDSYESMIYIAWSSVIAGFIFVRSSNIALAGTAILASVILFTAHLSWMDPQITNIVPVLNSYWLIIHVSLITASYGFLGLGAILAFITLSLIAMTNQNNAPRIKGSVSELTAVNEMALTVGLVLLTVGNFLGGVWANESWGRYWGWDPKETWALVTILIYAFVLHLRFIPAMRGAYVYNVASLLSFASVIMTYFGVNFYLSGLHSYAKGDPVPVPTFVYVSIVVVFLLIAAAYRKRDLGKS